jgi:hypothetical protein
LIEIVDDDPDFVVEADRATPAIEGEASDRGTCEGRR